MLSNVFLISIYSVLLLAEHPECQSFKQDRLNVTDKYQFAYRLGLIVFVMSFVNSSLINILLHTKVAKQTRLGTLSSKAETMMIVSDIC